ncbi:MAG TPA: DUF2255 family protein [Silvibacterium sp.]|nr:DUF2255 family protein [Silvibacterium sp.]
MTCSKDELHKIAEADDLHISPLREGGVQKAGRIISAGITKEVAFEPVDGPINDPVDEAYRTKYDGSPYLKPIGARARSATVRVMPRESEAP